MHEFQLIARFFSEGAAKRDDVLLGVGDDAALLRVPEGQKVVTAMTTVRDPSRARSPASLGREALALPLRSLRDAGATPAWATLALTLPEADEDWLARFSHSLKTIARRCNVALVGGDTTRGPLSVTVVCNGLAPDTRPAP
uniref:AIR synthase related protein, N-terminal domain n=1 Tax=Candidatus Kentrum eta TaxID=2126337 RepID=A0A450V0N2_9GAMM|nr:MAG: AIR synthase related protein, N-terminal domain [Candidatus Kentron sp. H]VFJ98370.1 MAG: AIR synthase related protein, N-terminal domain [Candidatus Kentron sp. H]VFK03481.1 MAG: AIR synthase related protein, N-terminal domain [Candidatus Kentron sp. H]